MARFTLAIAAASCATASAFTAPSTAKATTSLAAATRGAYDPSDFSDVQSLPGILDPTGFFDPANLAADASPSELKRYREAELTHGRVAMLAAAGMIVQELQTGSTLF